MKDKSFNGGPFDSWVNCKAKTTCTNSSEVKPDFALDQDQHVK